ncbi:FAD:protein FMN transferase [Undibacterium sp. Rencai35W]|uniref:FAD:protein FMN transferase n=1 Tax=Undibacterium sp. Rencai35W TaxID=3413046 RepID=UPI003BF00D90
MKQVFIPLSFTEPPALPPDAQLMPLSGHTMGTTWSVKLLVSGGPQLQNQLQMLEQGIQAQLDQVVAQMSTWLASSDLCQFNQAAAGTWHRLPAEFFKVLDYAIFIAQQSAGAYDPSIGRIVNLWGFGPDKYDDLPGDPALQEAKQSSGWQKLQLDRVHQRAYQPGGLAIDLSSIAKGFGVDQVARYLESQAIPSYLVEVGGELRGFGTKPDHQPWWVELEQAPAIGQATPSAQDRMNILALHGLSVATSGDYRRYIEKNGHRYSHTIDPRTAYPVTHPLASVTVCHAECMVADALATAMMVMGAEQGLAYANQLHVAALFLSYDVARDNTDNHFTEHMSNAMQAMLDA